MDVNNSLLLIGFLLATLVLGFLFTLTNNNLILLSSQSLLFSRYLASEKPVSILFYISFVDTNDFLPLTVVLFAVAIFGLLLAFTCFSLTSLSSQLLLFLKYLISRELGNSLSFTLPIFFNIEIYNKLLSWICNLFLSVLPYYRATLFES